MRIFTLLLCCLLIPVASFAQKKAPAAVDIQQSLIYAFSYSPLLKSALNAKDKSEFEHEIYEAAYYPTIGIWAGAGGMQESSQQTKKYDYFDDAVGVAKVGIGASQMLFDGFKTKYAVERSEHHVQSKLYQALDIASTLAYATISAHMDILRRQELIKATETNYKAHKKLVALLHTRHKEGISGLGDVEQGKARMYKVEAALRGQKNALAAAQANYQRVTGVRPPAKLAPVKAPKHTYTHKDEPQTLALTNNHQILLASSQIEQAKADGEAAKGGFYPQVTLDASASYYNADTNYDKDIYSWDVGVNMHWNVFNGGADTARVSAGAMGIRENRQLLQHTKDVIFEQIDVTLEQTLSAKEQLVSYEASQKASNISRKNFYEQYKVGQKGLLNLLDAEAEFYTAQVEAIVARTDVILGQYRLHALAGVLLSELRIEEILARSSIEAKQLPILKVLKKTP